MSRTRLIPLTLAALLLFGATPRAHAVNKDMVQLQTQVQQLQDAVARLQQTSDERWGVLKDLVQQTADSVNKMSAAVSGLQLKMQNVQDAAGQKNDQLSGQVQSLNDSLDELKARLDRIEKDLNSVQSSQQSTNALLGNLPGNVPPAGGAAAVPVGPANPTDSSGKPLPGTPLSSIANGTAPAPATLAPAASGNPPPGEMYRTAYSDYMSGKNGLSTSEFQELIKAYPDDNLAGNGYYYIGEMDLRAGHYSAAIKDYDHVLEHYPDNSKIPAAHLHKGDALVALHQNEAGIREYRALIQRFPNSPEAAQAKAKISLAARR
ncbi:MAG TPA: tetratricopeptide repeat protein [Acidobacteriaceae bacterium]|nr:tetratricopeptide repeat protein [Acidobacteriaceae bacterium]